MKIPTVTFRCTVVPIGCLKDAYSVLEVYIVYLECLEVVRVFRCG